MEKSDTMEIIHISKSFGSNVVLQDVSLQLIPGKCIAICGHNGCGKSTLLNAVAGFLRIDSGELQLKNAVLQYIPDHFFTTRMNARDFLMHMVPYREWMLMQHWLSFGNIRINFLWMTC